MHTASKLKGVCLVIGAGEGLGAAIANAFARDGHPVCLTRRARHFGQLETLDQIAANYVWLHGQQRSAWTHDRSSKNLADNSRVQNKATIGSSFEKFTQTFPR